jgi:glycosyltransferase involved in cell wall biosynthesis
MSKPVEKKQLKVLLLVQEVLYGGGSRQSLYILEELIRQGFSAVLISNAKTSWLGRQIKDLEMPVKCYFTSLIQRSINPVKEIGVILYLLSVFLKERPDKVITCGVKFIGLGCFAAWLFRIPCRIAIIRGQGASEESRSMKIIYAMEWLLARLGTRFITVCEYNRQEMIDKNVCAASNIQTIHNGTDIQVCRSGVKSRFRERIGVPMESFMVGMVGRFSDQKRYDLFIQFMALLCQRHRNVYGVLIGEGQNRSQLQEQIDQTGFSEFIRIVGFCENMPEVYADLDLSVLFTHYEGCANALLESTAAGVPMIAEAVCGNPEVVFHGKNGYIVPPGDIEQAAHYAEKLIMDPDLRKQIGETGRKIAENHFDHRKQTRKLIHAVSDFPNTDENPAGLEKAYSLSDI